MNNFNLNGRVTKNGYVGKLIGFSRDMRTIRLNPAVTRCAECLAELHAGLNGRDHEPDCTYLSNIVREKVGSDGHVYSLFSDGAIGHVNCWCFNKK